MHEQPPAMNEVVRLGFRLILRDVKTADLDVCLTEILQEACIYVGCDHRATRADALAEPTHNRTRTGANVQTPPTI
jgi:hypothetical protein